MIYYVPVMGLLCHIIIVYSMYYDILCSRNGPVMSHTHSIYSIYYDILCSRNGPVMSHNHSIFYVL